MQVLFIKSFVTILAGLFFVFIMGSKITADEEAGISKKITVRLLTWFIQATIGANIVVFLYYVWS